MWRRMNDIVLEEMGPGGVFSSLFIGLVSAGFAVEYFYFYVIIFMLSIFIFTYSNDFAVEYFYFYFLLGWLVPALQ